MATLQTQVLKTSCSLVGKSVIPVIMRVKAVDPDVHINEFPRLKKEEPLESYSKAALITEFEKLTDGNVSGGVSGAQEDTNRQLQAMRTDLDNLKNGSKEMQVDEALSYVRTSATRPKLTTPSVLLAGIEMLVDAANKANYKDSVMFSKSYSICKKFEDNTDCCGLVLKLFGSQADKTISALAADWAKSKKYEEPAGSKDNVANMDKGVSSNQGSLCPVMDLQVGPGFGFPYPHFYPGPHTGGFRPPMRGGRPKRISSVCFYCKDPGHFVANCLKVK